MRARESEEIHFKEVIILKKQQGTAGFCWRITAVHTIVYPGFSQ